jgi:hypothetical protein
MPSKIIRSPDVPDVYEKWTKEILQKLGPCISYREGSRVPWSSSINTIVARIFLLNEESYRRRSGIEGENSPFLKRGKMTTPDAYSDARARGLKSNEFYKDFPTIEFDITYGYWNPLRIGGSHDMPGVIGEITICIDRVKALHRRILPGLPDVDQTRIEEHLFKTVLLHEFGHHYSMANFSYNGIPDEDERDLFVMEGVAGLFANLMSDTDGRRVQAEVAAYQPCPYRIYQYLKHADITKLLECFMNEGSYQNLPSVFSYVIGGRHNLNGYLMSTKGAYDGVLIDWMDRGGQLVSGTFIKAVTSISKGCVISPRIGMLIGRYSPNVLVVAGEIENRVDYGILPANIKIIDEKQVKSVIEAHQAESSGTMVLDILAELGFDEGSLDKNKRSWDHKGDHA